MTYSGLAFIFHFFPLFLVVYFAILPKWRCGVLFLGSLFFYSLGQPGQPFYLLLLLILAVANYLLIIPIYELNELQRKKDNSTLAKRRGWLVIVLVLDFGVLVFFKYFDFLIEICNMIFKSDIKKMNLTLPLGISFFTFQMVSFAIDVYRGRYKRSISLIHYLTYATMFPQIISGPICRYDDVYEGIKNNKVTPNMLERGATLFVLGLSYKVLLADKIAALWNDIWMAGPYGIDTATAWLGAWGYSFQIYFDFYGYSLMAMGVGSILGFSLPHNFKSPYCVKTMTSFWRHWHITLGSFFRDYLYIPLGGNRKGKGRQVLNIFIVWMLTALWHGAGMNFLIWGIFLFLIMMSEKIFTYKFLEKTKVLGHLYMVILIPISWTIFNISDLAMLRDYFLRMFFMPLPGMVVKGYSKFTELISTYWWLLGLCIIFSTPYPSKLFEKFYKSMVEKVILLILFWYCVYQIIMGGSNPFVYFRF